MSLSPSSLPPSSLPLVSPGGQPPDDPPHRDNSHLDGQVNLSGVPIDNQVSPRIEDLPVTMVDSLGVNRVTQNRSEVASADEVMVESNTDTGKTETGPSKVSYAGMVHRNPNATGKNVVDSWEWNADEVTCGTYGHSKENSVGGGGTSDLPVTNNGKYMAQASTSTSPIEPSDLAPYGPWMTVENRQLNP
ncbi:hypothetical protein V6N13_135149 [Hibiscus sabdariffa]